MFKNIPFNRVEWVTSIFLISTAILAVTALITLVLLEIWLGLVFIWNLCFLLFGHRDEYYGRIP